MTVDEWLIDAVRVRPIIWNTKHHEYKNIAKKNEEYQAIADQFNVNVKDVRRKWHSIRSAFSRELRMRSLFSELGQEEKRTWKHFSKLLFLQGECQLELDGQVEHDYTVQIYENENSVQNNSVQNNSNDNIQLVKLPNNLQLGVKKKKMVNEQNNFSNSSLIYSPTSDEEVFGRSIAASLRKFDAKMQEVVKLKLQQVIVEHLMESN